MTRYKLPKQSIDDVKTDLWSISFLTSVGGGTTKGGALAVFDLFNRATSRAHVMTVSAAGDTSGLPVELSFRHSGYMKFKTEVPANFPDFNMKRAKLELKDRLGKSWRTVKVFRPDAIRALMEVEVNNWNITGWHAFEGHGFTEVYYSDGRPVGNPDYELRVELPEKVELPVEYKLQQMDFGLVIRMPGDVLFDFDCDWLNYEAAGRVSDLMKYINSLPRKYVRIAVEGHTDSKEKTPGYNFGLSLRRSQSVLDYFIKYRNFFDKEYKFDSPRGLGATKPVAPNTKPDGSDNPDGRALNRRIEVFLYEI